MENYQIEITKMFPALENLNGDGNFNSAQETLKRISKPQLKWA